jgi:hypothetical protein
MSETAEYASAKAPGKVTTSAGVSAGAINKQAKANR